MISKDFFEIKKKERKKERKKEILKQKSMFKNNKF